MIYEKLIGPRNRIIAQFLFLNGMDLGARGEGLSDFAFRVAGFNDVAGEQAGEFSFAVHDRKGAEGKMLFFDQIEDIAYELIRRGFDGVLYEAVDVVLDAADFGELL